MLQQAFRTLVRNKLATNIETVTKTNVKCFSNVPVTVSKEAQNLQELALDENCILVDQNDRSLGLSSKRDCHRVNADGEIKLHRAFSVFLFNTKGDMLLQKRSSHKVNLNTCFLMFKVISNLFVLNDYRLHIQIIIQTPVVVIHCSILKANKTSYWQLV